jgi:GTP-binding protein HflX
MKRKATFATNYRAKTLIIGVHAPHNTASYIDSYYQEFINLVETNRVLYDAFLTIKLRSIDSAYFFTKGKLENVIQTCKKENIDHVIISEQLTPQQERNLTDILKCKVYDRTQLILEIFEKTAESAEGKAQVSIAMLRHKKTRLAGKGIHMSQQAGILGLRGGFGETAKEKERRHIEKSILRLKKQLTKIEQQRKTQRKRRLDNNISHICLIGYTNAGKSTLLNKLTHAQALAENKLFATLDTTTRELYIDAKKIGILSDTVGFIQQLPHHLIQAFKSTLSELHYADLLLHVIDIANPNWESHINVVHKVLHEIGIDKETLYIFNKADLETACMDQSKLNAYAPHVIISAHNNNLAPLHHFLHTWSSKTNKNNTFIYS